MAGVPPKRGEAYTFSFSVTSQANTNIFQAAPAIAAGDFQYSNDGGATFNNPATIPAVVAGNNKVIRAVLSGAEMTPSVGDKIIFVGSDAVGAQWQDYFEELTTVATPMDELIAAIWAYATRTLTSFGTLVADIWAYGTRTLTSFGTLVADIVSAILASGLIGSIISALTAITPVARALRALDLEIYRGDTWIQPISGLGNIAARTGLWITARFERDDPDSASAFQIEETAGLLYINAAPASVAANGSITVVDAALGNITVRLEAVETAKLAALNKLYYDVQWTDGTDVTTPRRGRLLVVSDVTRATS